MNNLQREIQLTEANMNNDRINIRKKYQVCKNKIGQPVILVPVMIASSLSGYFMAADKTVIELLLVLMRVMTLKRNANKFLHYAHHLAKF